MAWGEPSGKLGANKVSAISAQLRAVTGKGAVRIGEI
jgi:hypothetical protein